MINDSLRMMNNGQKKSPLSILQRFAKKRQEANQPHNKEKSSHIDTAKFIPIS
jgi:hypothetical protein